ncbi:MAG TPA: NTP transferase domain-containing protein [Phenylobacterium sp.]|nr:NTP transferase domain-containing protein [Phenylobacterium sp.]
MSTPSGVKLGAAILVGGASSRMGADKAQLDWGGRRAVDWLADLAAEAGADPIVTVGGGDYGLLQVADSEPAGGPVAGLVAAIAALRSAGCQRMLALAVDAPTARRADLEPLLTAPPPGAAFEGLHLPLVLDLAAAPDGAGGGWPIARFVERAGLARLPCAPEAHERLRGANTPQERARLLAAAHLAEKGGAG